MAQHKNVRCCQSLEECAAAEHGDKRCYRNISKSLPDYAVSPWLISNLMHKIRIYLYIIHLLKSSTCFEHYPAHLREVCVVTVYIQPLVSSLSAGDCPVPRLRKNFFLNRCTRQSPAESDDTRGFIYIQLRRRPPEDKRGNARNM